jgi:hypothetical protein
MESNFQKGNEKDDLQKYLNFAESSYKSVDDNSGVPKGFEIDKSLSDGNRKTFVNKDTKEIVISNTGTRINQSPSKTWKDLKSDFLLATGLQKFDGRVKQSRRHLDAVKNKYKDGNITLTGHSLGGSLANYTSNDPRVKKAITFNQGFTPLTASNSKSTNYYTKGDVISNIGSLLSKGRNIVIKSNKRNKHSLSSFR